METVEEMVRRTSKREPGGRSIGFLRCAALAAERHVSISGTADADFENLDYPSKALWEGPSTVVGFLATESLKLQILSDVRSYNLGDLLRHFPREHADRGISCHNQSARGTHRAHC